MDIILLARFNVAGKILHRENFDASTSACMENSYDGVVIKSLQMQ